MPDVVSDEDLNALAAEFVLGTLDYEERKGATALLEVDHAFRGIVRIWERRLGELHLMVEAVEPDADIWARIRPQIAGLEQVELAIPSHAETVAAAEEVSAAAAAVGPEPASVDDVASSSRAPVADVSATAPSSTTSEKAADLAADEAFMAGRSRSLDETELRLTELAALLPVTGQEHTAPPLQAGDSSSPPSVPEPTHADARELTGSEPNVAEPNGPEAHVTEAHVTEPNVSESHGPESLVPELQPVEREFVPPPPMAARNVTVLEAPVRKVGRGWIAATWVMGLVAMVLAGLIGAWRYFPERLPAQLGVYSVLNLPSPPTSSPPEPRPEPPPPFDE